MIVIHHKLVNFNRNQTLIVIVGSILSSDFKWGGFHCFKWLKSNFELSIIQFVSPNHLSLPFLTYLNEAYTTKQRRRHSLSIRCVQIPAT